MRRRDAITVLLALGSMLTAVADAAEAPQPNSLHFKRGIMVHSYHKESGGFENLTGIPGKQLECGRCHQSSGKRADGTPVPVPFEPSCADCHDFSKGTAVQAPQVCLDCHVRQAVEVAFFDNMKEPKDLSWQDAHARKGMTCTACHTAEHLHQDAGDVMSALDPKGVDARCDTCHPAAKLTGQHHQVHGDRLACAACHMKASFTCTNCHFDTEVAVKGKFKRPIHQSRGFTLLMNRKGNGPGGKDQVYPATFMSMVYQGKTYYTIAPFHSHTVMAKGHACEACHGSEPLKAYDATGKIVLTRWNDETKKLDTVKGFVPVPADWSKAFQVDFAEFKGDLSQPKQPEKWVFLKQGADLTNLMGAYCAPLTADQMAKLRLPVSQVSASR
jgi:hypothetical protein